MPSMQMLPTNLEQQLLEYCPPEMHLVSGGPGRRKAAALGVQIAVRCINIKINLRGYNEMRSLTSAYGAVQPPLAQA